MNTSTLLSVYLNGVPAQDAQSFTTPSNQSNPTEMSSWEKHKKRFHHGEEPEAGHCSLKDDMDRKGGGNSKTVSGGGSSGKSAARSYLDSLGVKKPSVGEILKEDDVSISPRKNSELFDGHGAGFGMPWHKKRGGTGRRWYQDDVPWNVSMDRVKWVPTSLGGSSGYWEEKTEEEMIDEYERHGRLVPGKKPVPFSPYSPQELEDRLYRARRDSQDDRHVNSITKSFLSYCRNNPGVFNKWIDDAFGKGMDLQKYINHRLGDYKPSFGRVPNKKWDEIVSSKSSS
ncbi:MAG: hypothetical protein MJZ81_09585 [Bacteroidales bacterium]|nr:hypothetical protein [Bacteroidales bacterium]